MKLQRCWSLTKYPIRGTWYRAILAQYATTPLAFAHTATRSGRFAAPRMTGAPRDGVLIVPVGINGGVVLRYCQTIVTPLDWQNGQVPPGPVMQPACRSAAPPWQ